jgi:hypothetical protein
MVDNLKQKNKNSEKGVRGEKAAWMSRKAEQVK